MRLGNHVRGLAAGLPNALTKRPAAPGDLQVHRRHLGEELA
jgi:hypothetical protein